MSLIERWKAKETKLGKLLKKEVFIVLGILAAFAHGLDTEIAAKLTSLPPDWVPDILKHALSVLTVAAPIAGKLTAASPDPPAPAK